MTVGLDASVVVRLLIGEPQEQASEARRWLEDVVRAGGEPVHLSDLVVGESYFALRHHYAVPHNDALQALHALATDHRIRADSPSSAVLRDPRARDPRPGFMDRLIHQRYRADGLGMATFDKQAANLPGASLVPAAHADE